MLNFFKIFQPINSIYWNCQYGTVIKKSVLATLFILLTGCENQINYIGHSLEKLPSTLEQFGIIEDDVNSNAGDANKLFGVDISHYQGNFIKEIKANDHLSFVICKATQGEHYVDPKFHSNWQALERKDLVRGAYHFFDNSVDATDQADHFIRQISDLKRSDLAPILDIEQGSFQEKMDTKKLQNSLIQFLNKVEQQFGRVPILYTNYEFAQIYLNNSLFKKYPLWLAEYTGGEEPMVPNAWKTVGVKIWQKTDSQHLHSKTVDLDVFEGSKRELVND